jgi:hypothetical protein
MTRTMPLTGNGPILRGLSDLYLITLGVLLVSLVISALNAGYEPGQAQAACAVAAVACALVRLDQRLRVVPQFVRDGVDLLKTNNHALLGTTRLLIETNRLVRLADGQPEQVGLLVAKFQEQAGISCIELTSGLAQEFIEVDESTIGLPVLNINAAAYLERVGSQLLEAARAAPDGLESGPGLTIGIAVAREPDQHAADLLSSARTAIRAAQRQGRDMGTRLA